MNDALRAGLGMNLLRRTQPRLNNENEKAGLPKKAHPEFIGYDTPQCSCLNLLRLRALSTFIDYLFLSFLRIVDNLVETPQVFECRFVLRRPVGTAAQ